MNINDVYQRNDELIKIARYHNPKTDGDALDAVQTLYLKLCEIESREGNLDRLFFNGSLNMVYIFTSLRNIIINQYRENAKYVPLGSGRKVGNTDIPSPYEIPDAEEEEDITTPELCAAFRGELSKMRQYDRLMIYAYYNDGHSIRSLAKAVGISPKNVFITLRRVKNRLKETAKSNPKKYPKV